MNLLTRENERNNRGLLSVTRPVSILQTNTIEYIKIEKKPLKVFADDTKFCITNSAAYELGLLTVEEFNNSSNEYYYIGPTFLEALRRDYNVEIESLNVNKETENKQL